MQIAGRSIGPDHPPYVIAEASCNHAGVYGNAVALIAAAKLAGADAIKFQAYTPDTITLDSDRPDFIIKDGPWRGRRLHDLYAEAHTPFQWFPALFAHARDLGITAFASVFDGSSVDMLERLNCPAYKIASFEIVDTPLIAYAARTGKPLILSTGMASDEECAQAWLAIREACGTPDAQAPDAIPLHCVSGYPTPVEEANLARLKAWERWRGQPFGLSDHTVGSEIPIAATALGACVIEKHLKLKGVNTADAAFSATPVEFKEMTDAVRRTWRALQPGTAASEQPSRQLRRSLYAVRDIAAGEPLSEQNVRSIRPGNGLPPKMLPEIVGAPAACAIARGAALTDDMIGARCGHG